jgi:hypothetical protein
LSQCISNDYLLVTLSKDAKSTTKTVHTLVAEHFVPNPLNKSEVNHRDGNKRNNWYWNLEWNTHVENMHHAYKNGLANSTGESNSMAKLSEKQVLEIRKLYKEGILAAQIAKQYQVSYHAVYDIIKRKNWKHV